MQKNILIIVAVVIILGAGAYALNQRPCEGASCSLNQEVRVLQETGGGPLEVSSPVDSNVSAESTAQGTEVSSPVDPNVSAESIARGTYEVYRPELLERADEGVVVLFFHASWCPSCRGLSANIEANRDAIPAGLTILKLDYDREVELKKKYGVTYQHTLVQVDANGNLIKKWSGGASLQTIVDQVN